MSKYPASVTRRASAAGRVGCKIEGLFSRVVSLGLGCGRGAPLGRRGMQRILDVEPPLSWEPLWPSGSVWRAPRCRRPGLRTKTRARGFATLRGNRNDHGLSFGPSSATAVSLGAQEGNGSLTADPGEHENDVLILTTLFTRTSQIGHTASGRERNATWGMKGCPSSSRGSRFFG